MHRSWLLVSATLVASCAAAEPQDDSAPVTESDVDAVVSIDGVAGECDVDLDCGPAGPCDAPRCTLGRCMPGRQPAGTPCLGGRCYDGECLLASPSTCDRDGDCEEGEDCVTCPGDCGAPSAWSVPTRFGQFDEPATDESPTFTADGSTVYFTSTRPGLSGPHDVWMATRVGDGSFSEPNRVVELSSPGDDAAIYVSRDGLDAVITWKPGQGPPPSDLLLARRASREAPFSAPRPIDEVNTLYYAEMGGSFSDDALTLLFSSNRPGGTGGFDLWYTSRYDRESAFQPPRPLDEVNSVYTENSPVLLPGGLELIYAWGISDSRHDVWVARRPSLDARFGKPVPVPELTTQIMDVFSPMPDGVSGVLYQRSQVPGRPDPIKLPRDQELWLTTRTCPPR